MLHRRTLRGEFIDGLGRILPRDLFQDARGLQTLEWVALAIVILALLGAVAAYLRSNPDLVGGAVAEAIRSFFNRLSETFGPILSPFFPFPPIPPTA
ncbi:hypothetical protein [Thermoflexus hugenholtzii]|jgi:hypothetical protein|uniref:Uncharacterized protein n=1 Tax=Thermoflexus hugenholtzii JAD2 TaxID=877466 RepID=A0A212QSH0_9CHLR|nr:hypothetical protein [Thermoflexus hugenholtzii]SNB62406.1 hypothetical protein SAMN02746019_00005100 [Thermoflexus hugenholtzii JAD2]